jgi:hypothetical protein
MASMDRFEIELEAMPIKSWDNQVDYVSRFGAEGRFPISRFLLMRLFEIEAHHVDLNVRYRFIDTPVGVRSEFLELAAGTLGQRCGPFMIVSTDTGQRIDIGGVGTASEVVGDSAALIGWLTGRDNGDRLRALNQDPLPWLPPFA